MTNLDFFSVSDLIKFKYGVPGLMAVLS